MNHCTHDTLIRLYTLSAFLSMVTAAGRSHTVEAAVKASEGSIQTAFVLGQANEGVTSWPGCILTSLGYHKGQHHLKS